MPKMNVSSVKTMDYQNKPRLRTPEKQSQNKPNFKKGTYTALRRIGKSSAADGDWNLNDTAELLNTRYREHGFMEMLFVDQTVRSYWFYKKAVRKFDSKKNICTMNHPAGGPERMENN